MFMQGWYWIHIPAALSYRSEACHAHASTSVFGKSCCPPTYRFSKFPLGVSFNRNTLRLPSFNWCFFSFYESSRRADGNTRYHYYLHWGSLHQQSAKRYEYNMSSSCWPTLRMWHKHKRTASLLALVCSAGWPVSLTLLIRSVLA